MQILVASVQKIDRLRSREDFAKSRSLAFRLFKRNDRSVRLQRENREARNDERSYRADVYNDLYNDRRSLLLLSEFRNIRSLLQRRIERASISNPKIPREITNACCIDCTARESLSIEIVRGEELALEQGGSFDERPFYLYMASRITPTSASFEALYVLLLILNLASDRLFLFLSSSDLLGLPRTLRSVSRETLRVH